MLLAKTLRYCDFSVSTSLTDEAASHRTVKILSVPRGTMRRVSGRGSMSLSEEDLADVRAELSAHKRATVWFTPAAVGVAAGGSAKVIAIDESAEGDFIQVQATGSRDTMFCSPNELTRVRPTRKRRQPAAASVPSAPATPKRVARPEPAVPAGPEPAPAAPPRQRARATRVQRPVEVTITLCSTPEGEWTVEVVSGKKRTVRPTHVPPGDVAKAARSLPPAVSEAIESSLQAARQRQRERVEQLRGELEAAQRALQELTMGDR
jgi:hypothetical protein